MLTTDTRRQPLVFKASVYELSVALLLVEFRRSKVSHLGGLAKLFVPYHGSPNIEEPGRGGLSG